MTNHIPYHYPEPYHYYADLDGTTFKHLGFGLEYISYLGKILDLVRNYAKPECKLVDFGCGDGKLLYELSTKYGSKFSELCGVETSKTGRAFAAAYHHGFGTKFFEDLSELSSATYDVVTAVEVFEHLTPSTLTNVLFEIKRVLKPGGILIVCVPSIGRECQPQHRMHYTTDLLSDAVSPYLREISCFYYYRIGMITNLFSRILENRFFIIRHGGIRKLVLRAFRQYTEGDVGVKKSAHVIGIYRAQG